MNLTRFSTTVSGTADSGVTSVTVDLLRNTVDATGNVVRNQVDTFTANVSSGTWSGSFSKHAFADPLDQVEVNYTGGGQQVTIGSGHFLLSADNSDSTKGALSHAVGLPANFLDGKMAIASDGKTLFVEGFCPGGSYAACPLTATVGSASPVSPTTSNGFTFASWDFTSSPLTNGSKVVVTDQVSDQLNGSGGVTRVNLTDNAPLLSVLTGADGVEGIKADEQFMPQPNCQAFLVTSAVICGNLTPGTYTLTHGSASQTLTVPAAPSGNTDFIPHKAGAVVTGMAAGDTVSLSTSGRTISTLTIDPMTFTRVRPFGDLLTGANRTVTGTCTGSLWFFESSSDLCPSNGTIATPNILGELGLLGQLDEFGPGQTLIDIPDVALATPTFGESVYTPFHVFAIPRSFDQVAAAAAADVPPPANGPAPTVPSLPSAAPVQFLVAPLGTNAFAPLGNANVAGGILLPTTLPIGPLQDRFLLTDNRGDIDASDQTFAYQGNIPSVQTGPAVPKCSLKETKKTKTVKVKKKKKKVTTVTLAFTCTSPLNGARVALWLTRANKVVTDGSGVVSKGKVTIKFSSTSLFKKGTYGLVTVIDFNGSSAEGNTVVKVK